MVLGQRKLIELSVGGSYLALSHQVRFQTTRVSIIQ